MAEKIYAEILFTGEYTVFNGDMTLQSTLVKKPYVNGDETLNEYKSVMYPIRNIACILGLDLEFKQYYNELTITNMTNPLLDFTKMTLYIDTGKVKGGKIKKNKKIKTQLIDKRTFVSLGDIAEMFGVEISDVKNKKDTMFKFSKFDKTLYIFPYGFTTPFETKINPDMTLQKIKNFDIATSLLTLSAVTVALLIHQFV